MHKLIVLEKSPCYEFINAKIKSLEIFLYLSNFCILSFLLTCELLHACCQMTISSSTLKYRIGRKHRTSFSNAIN